jgi:hypothetical protein
VALQTELKLNLPVGLSQEDKAKIGEQMSKVELLIDAKETQKKSVTDSFNKQIKDLSAELHALAKQFEENTVMKEIDCIVEFNKPEKGKKTIIRTDDNTVARVVAMSEYEVKEIEQPGLFDQEKAEAQKQNEAAELTLEQAYGFDPLEYIGPQLNIDECDFFVAENFEQTKSEMDADESFTEDQFNEVRGCLFVLMTEDEHERLKADSKGQFVGMYDCNEQYSWFVFEPIPQVVPESEQELNNENKIPVYNFNPDEMDREDIESSYSGDVLEKNRIRGIFQFLDKAYVNVGGTSDQIEAFELIPAEDYVSLVHAYDKDFNYEGHKVTHMKKQFVLSNPIKIVFESEKVENDPEPQDKEEEFAEYQLPEKE